MFESYPNEISIDTSNISDIDWLLNVITAIRNIRAENKIGFKEPLQFSFKNIDEDKKQYIKLIEEHTNVILANIQDDMVDNVIDKNTTLSILLPQTNKGEEIKKAKEELENISKRIESLKAQISKMEGKAPANVIEDRKKSLNDAIEKKSQLEQIIG